MHISDTHGVHDQLVIPDGDVLIHSGDFFSWDKCRGFDEDAKILDEFFAKQPHEHKVNCCNDYEQQLRMTISTNSYGRLSSFTASTL